MAAVTKISAGSRPAPALPAAPAAAATRERRDHGSHIKAIKQADVPEGVAKAVRSHLADRPTCAIVRKEAANSDLITKAADTTARQGSLRYNIMVAIQSSKTVADAIAKEVHGPGKHEAADKPYRIKRVDVGFALANGLITLTKVAK
jgi:hypothetical protein